MIVVMITAQVWSGLDWPVTAGPTSDRSGQPFTISPVKPSQVTVSQSALTWELSQSRDGAEIS